MAGRSAQFFPGEGTLTKVVEIPLSEIKCDWLPPPSDPGVAAIAASIKETVLMNPVTVRAGGPRGYVLIAGRYRMAAHYVLNRPTIAAHVTTLEGDLAELAELDENLARADRTALQLSDLIEQRKTVYERLHPEAKHGGDRKSDQVAGSATRSFADDTASKAGMSARKVREHVQVARDLVPAAKAAIAETSAADSLPDLVALSQLDPADQVRVAKHVAKAKRPTPVKRAVKELKTKAQDRMIKKYVAAAGRYEVILDDPSWKYRQTLKAMDRDLPYPPETLAKIKADVPSSDDNCTLYLCTTNAHMREAFDVVEAWGFRWTGAIITWGKVDKNGKPRMGMGFWIRGCTEHVLICVKGKPVHRGQKGDSLLLAERGANSEKPDGLYALIEQLSPAKTKLERHARKARPGWTTSGAELPGGKEFLVGQSAGRFYLTHAGAAALSPQYGVKRGAEIFRAGAMAERLVEIAAAGAGRVPKKLIRIVEQAQRDGQRGLTKRRKTA